MRHTVKWALRCRPPPRLPVTHAYRPPRQMQPPLARRKLSGHKTGFPRCSPRKPARPRQKPPHPPQSANRAHKPRHGPARQSAPDRQHSMSSATLERKIIQNAAAENTENSGTHVSRQIKYFGRAIPHMFPDKLKESHTVGGILCSRGHARQVRQERPTRDSQGRAILRFARVHGWPMKGAFHSPIRFSWATADRNAKRAIASLISSQRASRMAEGNPPLRD